MSIGDNGVNLCKVASEIRSHLEKTAIGPAAAVKGFGSAVSGKLKSLAATPQKPAQVIQDIAGKEQQLGRILERMQTRSGISPDVFSYKDMFTPMAQQEARLSSMIGMGEQNRSLLSSYLSSPMTRLQYLLNGIG